MQGENRSCREFIERYQDARINYRKINIFWGEKMPSDLAWIITTLAVVGFMGWITWRILD
jgi:hypothetical protein